MEEDKIIVENDDTFELKMHKVGSWLNTHLPSIFAIFISLFFVFSGLVEILPTAMSIKEQVIMAFINIVAGFTITSLVGEGGFNNAKSTSVYANEINEYNKQVQKGLEWREGIENLAKKKANDNLKNYRRQLLESVGLRYGDIFDNDGHLITEYDISKHRHDQNYHKKVKMFHKAINTKIHLTNVFGRASSSTYGLKKEVSEKSFRTKNGITKAISKVLLGVFSVGIMFNWLGFTWGALIYSFMQVVLWTGMGLIDRQKNFNFILNEIVPQYESNRLIIQEFLALPDKEKQKYMPSEYLMIEMKQSVETNLKESASVLQ